MSYDYSKENHSTTIEDVKQLGTFAALASLSYVFWIVGGMEMVERLAYYGVKAVAALYATDAQSDGGLGVTASTFGTILAIWALVQTFVPVVTGGLSDRLGYKETIFMSTVFKIIGYLIMALFPTAWGFGVGAVVLAFGTGIFKPGIQGTLVKSTNRENSSMAWGVFYQTVNIGGFLGPIVAAMLRQMDWAYVFYACAAIISLNFLLLLAYKEPGKEERIAHAAKVKSGEIKQESLLIDSLRELANPVLIWYLVLFSAFWFMFNALFDVLPLHLRDWVDTSAIVTTLFGEGGTQNSFFIRLLGMTDDGKLILPEGLLNWNAGLIMLTCFLFAGLSAKLRAVDSMMIGTFLASAALCWLGNVSWGWYAGFGILIFSIGEMMSSPKSSEFIGNIAPPQKKAMYLGFTQLPIGIGWTLEAKIGPWMYGEYASKETFSRELLLERGMDAAQVAAIKNGEAFNTLVDYTGESAQALTQLLHSTHNVAFIWYVMGGVGFVAVVGMFIYGRWLRHRMASGQGEGK
ncbi:MAG: MFS transporter [Porticoccaceae bacterium]|nr:MFS transporter [Porticoccaceae bacterium]